MKTTPTATTGTPLPRWAGIIVWAVAVLSVALPPLTALASRSDAAPDVGLLSLGLALSSSALVGAFIVNRIPRNAVGWLLLATGIVFGVNLASQIYVGISIADHAGTLPLTSVLAWFAGWSFVVAVVLVGVYVPLLFPDGRLPSTSRRWTAFLVLATASFVLNQLPFMFAIGPLEDEPTLTNPFGILDIRADLELLNALNTVAILTIFPIAMAAPVIRFRRAAGVERQQLKWFGSVAIATLLMLIPAFLGPWDLDLFWVLFLIGLTLIPVAIGVAILRYRLYEIDRLVSRTIGYAVITGGLVVVYLAVNLVLSSLSSSMVGGNALVVAASTLAVAALFTPVRRRVQRAVDRRFDRARYDAESTTMAFSARLRDEVDLPTVTTDLRSTVQAAISPTRVDLWLRENGR
jgi:hypothetical protein